MNNITIAAEMVAESVTQMLADQALPITLSAIEQMTRETLKAVGNCVVQQIASAQLPVHPDKEIVCECGKNALYKRKRSAQFHTMLGTIRCERHYYLCPHCHTGLCPLDKQLGVGANQMSALKSQLAAQVGVQLPFDKGSQLFEKLTLIPICDVAVGKATCQQGKQVTTQETALHTEATNTDNLRQVKRETPRPTRLYGSLDATKINVRHQKNDVRWRDLKVGAWFEATGKPPQSPDGDWKIVAHKIDYFADMTTASEFSSLVWATGFQRHAQLARELIFIADGAEWIWNIIANNFPNAVQILDWFHAVEHLLPVAQAVFNTPDQQANWCKKMKQWLWDGELTAFFNQFETLMLTFCHDVIRKTHAYFLNHRDRIRYAYFRQQGYQIGSGTIESAAKQIGIMRMKVPGAIWKESNAPLIAKARASFLSHTSNWAALPHAV